MNDEMLTTYDEQGKITGSAPRDEVHRLGWWHETFHCWFVSMDKGSLVIYLQLRSAAKKDYAGLLDITVAGHLLVNETAEDGVREVEEELGLPISYSDLIPLGIIPYTMIKDGLIDRERAHIFLYENRFAPDAFRLQQEEVAGIVKASFADFRRFWHGEQDTLDIAGFRVDNTGHRIPISMTVDKTHFVPHDSEYYEQIIEGIEATFSE